MRELVANGLCSNEGVFRTLDAVAGRLRGGMILALHDVPVDRFASHVEAIGVRGLVSLDELIDRVAAGTSTTGLYAITFDDGVGDVTRRTADLARRRGWPVTFYIPTAYLDDPSALTFQLWARIQALLPRTTVRLSTGPIDFGDAAARRRFIAGTTAKMYSQREETFVPMLRELAEALVRHGHATETDLHRPPPITWNEVAELARDPLLQFESHGMTHRPVSALTDAEVEHEARESQRRLADATGRTCRHFCYPYGGDESIGTAAPRILARYYASAVTMARGRLRAHDPMRLPRVPLYAGDSGNVARLKAITA